MSAFGRELPLRGPLANVCYVRLSGHSPEGPRPAVLAPSAWLNIWAPLTASLPAPDTGSVWMSMRTQWPKDQ